MPESVPPDDLAAPDNAPTPLAPVQPGSADRAFRAGVESGAAPANDVATVAVVGVPQVPVGSGVARVPEMIGPYRVVRTLGRGGMGVVYEAHDSVVRRSVAIKVMNAGVSTHPGAREQFMREAQLAAAVESDHVVPVFFVGEQAGAPYIVLPLLRGESLEERLKRGRLEPAEVIRVGREVAAGLAAAHDRGILHRDLKPGNVWLDADTGRARILDFGLARASNSPSDLNRPGVMAGSPPYMAPEQVDGSGVDERADLFALGALLYECATGQRAFHGPTIAEILKAVADRHPAPPRDVNPSIPPALSELIVGLLAKKAADRPPSARAVAAELAAIPGLTGGAPTAEPAPPSPPRRRRSWAFAASLGAVLVLAGGVAVWRGALRSGGAPNVPDGGAGGAVTEPTKAPVTAPPAVEPLRIVALDVHHFEKVGENRGVASGVFGQRAIRPRLGDQVTVEARLNRPAYAYLVAFAPDGQVHRLSDDQPTRKVESLSYPAAVRDEATDVRYGLTDGTGLYVFAVLVSEHPLPPFAAVAEGANWAPLPAAAGEVYRYDGVVAETISVRDGGLVRDERGPNEKALGASGGVVSVGARLLKAVPAGRVMAVGFGVESR